MQLSKFLNDTNTTEATFAQAIGVAQVTVNRYVQGKRFPDRKMIRKIWFATGGSVAPADWYAEESSADAGAAA